MTTNAAQAPASPASVKKMYWGGIASKVLGLALGLLCLRQWNSPNPWARLDLYSGGFFVVAVIATVAEALTFLRRGLRSVETAREAFGLSYDPGLLRWSALLSIGELAVILDYAHWHLVPALERPLFQGLGLTLLIASALWLAWTDTWLARHFSSEQAAGQLMTQGPYRFVRHPRYVAFLFAKLAFPLLFASIIGWALAPTWVALLGRRIRREEAHLRKLFGADYDAYARRTARLLPGLF